VQAIFSAHPELTVAHESQFVPRLAKRPYLRDGRFDSDMFVRDLRRSANFVRLSVDVDALRDDLAANPPASYPDAVRRVFRLYAHARGKTRYGDKTPGYVLHMEQLADLFPEARFVHVVRDGRDVALSYLETRFGPRTLPEAALYWRRRVLVGRHSGRLLGPERYRELRYEELVDDPESVVRGLCDFLGVEFSEEMLRYHVSGGQLRSETADPTAHRHLSLPPTAGLRDWRVQMSAQDVTVFETLAGNTLETFGYERSELRPSLKTMVRSLGGWMSWQLRRATHQALTLVNRRRARSSHRLDIGPSSPR
jgi:hypothetical protein